MSDSTVYPIGATVTKTADISEDGIYRYSLSRRWGQDDTAQKSLPFIMLNPSTADAEQDDNTVRKCVGFARRLGYDSIVVLNLYAYRATDPADLRSAIRSGVDAVGPENDNRLQTMLTTNMTMGRSVVAAWGAHAPDARVREVLAAPGSHALCSLGTTAKGAPRHPLMLSYEGAALTPLFRLLEQGNPDSLEWLGINR